VATVTLALDEVGPQTIDRLAELVARRSRGGRTGNVPIRSEDFETGLQIAFADEVRVLSSEVLSFYPADLGPAISNHTDGVDIQPLVLNPGDGFAVQTLVSGFAGGGDAQPVAVRVYEGALPPGEPFLIDGNPELLGHGIDVLDIQVDQRVRPSVTLVLREVKPGTPACHGHEPGKAGLKLMLPLFDEPEPPVPRDGPPRVLDIENGHNLLVHGRTLMSRRKAREARVRGCSFA
jgi:hypothetical protein